MKSFYRWLSVVVAFTLVVQTTIQPMAYAMKSATSLPPIRTCADVIDDTDTDGDGICDLKEAELGTNPWQEDSDFDHLSDKWEYDHGLDPLDPDTNDDGLIDYQEIVIQVDSGGEELDLDLDSDGDGQANIIDEDNDNDGVRDGLDISPFAQSNYQDVFTFNLKTTGKATYINISLRPENPDHLLLPEQDWNWPYDTRGQMQDLDYSEKDVKIVPVLEFETASLNMILSKTDADNYGISVDGDKAYLPLISVKDKGYNVAFSGKMFLPASLAAGEIEL